MTSTTSISQPSFIAFAAWLAGVALVFGSLGIYGSKPGIESRPPIHWPSESHLKQSDKGSTLLLFVHPKCPCSRATFDNLKDVEFHSSLSIVVVCSGDVRQSPSNLTSCSPQLLDWQQQTGVTLFHDVDGKETTRFQATTSGHCLLYDHRGTLMFSGGITSSRGHQGVNAGMASLQSALDGRPMRGTYPVFGCPLLLESWDPPADGRDSVDKCLLPACCKGDCRA